MSRITVLGALVASAGLAAFIVAFIYATLAPALAGCVLWVGLIVVRGEAVAPRLDIRRELPQNAQADQPFQVVLHITSRDARPWRVTEMAPSGLELDDPPGALMRGAATLRYTATSPAPGRVRWRNIRVAGTDRWGLWQFESLVPAHDTLQVGPEPEWATRGRAIGRRNRVRTVVAGAHNAEPRNEVARIRPYIPGDRPRDIDWKRTSRQPGMWTRERVRGLQRPVTILMDVGNSMRAPGYRSRLSTATDVALGIASAAEAAGVSCGLVAFHEDGIISDGNLHSPSGPKGILRRFAELPEPRAVATIDSELGALAPDEQEFLRNVAGVAPGTPLPPWQAAMSRILNDTSGLIVAILDADRAPKRSYGMVHHLRTAQRDVILVSPAWGPHQARRASMTQASRQDVEEAYANRTSVATRLAAQRVVTLAAVPENVQEVIQEVAARAQ